MLGYRYRRTGKFRLHIGRRIVKGETFWGTCFRASLNTSERGLTFRCGWGGGLSDPLIPVEVRVLLWLAPELLTACSPVLVLHATPYSTCRIVLRYMARYHSYHTRYHPYHTRYTVHAALYSTVLLVIPVLVHWSASLPTGLYGVLEGESQSFD